MLVIKQEAIYCKKDDERALVASCLDNDQKSQKRLYDKYCNAMYSSAYRILGDHDLANDALQESFIQVFRILNQFQFRSSLGAWIKSIVIHASLKILKKQRPFTFAESIDDMQSVTWEEPMSGEYLEKAILDLPPGYRVVFLLVEVEGYRHKEVAEMMNISEGTSKSQLFRAKKQLKNILSAYNI